MAKANLLLFIDSLCSGGAQRQLVELAKHIDQSRFAVSVLIYHDLRHFGPELESRGIQIVLIEKGGGFDPVFLFRLARYLRRARPDIIQSFLKGPNVWARLAGRAAGIRHIVSSERNTSIEQSAKWMLLERLTHFASSCIVTPTESIRQVLVERVGIPGDKVRVIHSGVDVTRFQQPDPGLMDRLRRRFAFDAGDFVLTLPGRMHRQKNHLCLVRAVDVLRNGLGEAEFRRVKVLFVGNEEDRELRARLQSEVESRKLGQTVVFGGEQQAMKEIYAISDVVMLPSLWEGLPNVVLEAMAAARPVIASDVSDNARIVRDGESGYVFASDDAEELAACIGKLIAMDASSREAMGAAGRRLVRERFAIDVTAAAYQSIYHTCLGAPSSPR